eukprot:452049_1
MSNEVNSWIVYCMLLSTLLSVVIILQMKSKVCRIGVWQVIHIQIYRHWLLDKVALFFRYLMLDETIMIAGPLLVWILDPIKGMFIPSAIGISEYTNGLMKWCLQIPRPFWISHRINNIGGKHEQDFSFPSSHASSVACGVLSIYIQFLETSTNKWEFLFLVVIIGIAIMTGISRVYLGVHAPIDVIIGWISGCTVSLSLEHFEVFEWFIKMKTFNQILFAIVLPIVGYGLLSLIKLYVLAPSTKTIEKWKEIGKISAIKPRKLSKYDMQIMYMSGACIACAMSIRELREGKLRFLEENCWQYGELSVMVLRCVLGLIGIFIIYTFVTVRKLSFWIMGLWLFYLLPKVAYEYVGLECPIYACDVNISSGYYDVISGNFTPYTDALTGFQIYSQCLDNVSTIYNYPNFDQQYANSLKPQNVSHLQEIILNAATENSYKLRARGAYQSTPSILHFKDPNIENIEFVSLEHFQHYEIIRPSEDELEYDGQVLVVVGAGMCIGLNNEIYCKKWNDTLVSKLWKDGYAIQTVAGTLVQTVGGLFSTDSKGGSIYHKNDEIIRGFKYVNGKGEKREVWRNDTTGNKDYYAFGVSMGLAGIIYEIILEPIPRYCLEVKLNLPKKERMNVENIISLLTNKEYDYGRLFVWSPDEHNKAFVEPIFVKKVELDESWTESKINGCGIVNNHYASSMRRVYDDVVANMIYLQDTLVNKHCLSQIEGDLCLMPFMRELMNVAKRRHARHDIISYERCARTIFDNYDVVSGDILDLDDMNMKCLFDPFLSAYDSTDNAATRHYYNILPFDHVLYTEHGDDIWIVELNFPLKLNNNSYVHIINAYMECPLPEPRYVDEFYMAPKSDFWMSSAYESEVFRINLFMSFRVYLYEEIHKRLRMFCSCFADRNIAMRFHFGKVLPIWRANSDNKDFEIMKKSRETYPMFKSWIEFIEREDPDEIFRTKYWKRAFWD